MPLHTDYRPTKLDQVVGNQTTIQALKTHLTKKSPNRSLLFTGNPGCGKTTLAICIANELDAYDNWNFQLLNAADFRGIDTVREVREAANRTPIGGAKARVWLWDEGHKISVDGQEAMLKLLEDPPKNCWFILATTNPEKLKPTLKRRCTEFRVEPVGDKDLSKLLFNVSRQEKKRLSNELINQIILNSEGSPGIALNLLDKVIDLPPEDAAKAIIKWKERDQTVINLCRTMLSALKKKASWKDLLEILKELEEEDHETIRRQVLEYFRKVGIGGDESAYLIMSCFRYPYYDTGKAGLYMSLYETFNLET